MERYSPVETLIDVFYINNEIIERVGDCTNLEIKVNPNSAFWKTDSNRGGLTLQRDCFLKKARIIDSNRNQIANGSIAAMNEKMERLTSKEFLRPGDVIGVSRVAYEHYAIYAGDGKVIHYSGNLDDFIGEVSIQEGTLDEFLNKKTDYFVVSFAGRYPVKIHALTHFIVNSYFDYNNIKWKKVYSPEDTLKRAYSRIGETEYNVITNNCEHFALWCKTGKAVSTQVSRIASYLFASGIGVGNLIEKRDRRLVERVTYGHI